MNLKKWNHLLTIQKGTEREEKEPIRLFMNMVKKHIPKDSKILILGGTLSEKKRLEEAGYQNLTIINLTGNKGIIKMDMHDLRFKKETFDTVLAKNVIEHSFCPFMLFLEVRSILKQGGIFLFSLQKITSMGSWLVEHPFLTTVAHSEMLRDQFGFRKKELYNAHDMFFCVWIKRDAVHLTSFSEYQIYSSKFVKKWEEEFH